MWQRNDEIKNNRVAMAVDEWASRTRQSAIGPIVRDYNPFERFEVLGNVKEVRETVQHFKSPGAARQLLDNRNIAALRSDPKVSQAIEEIRRDPVFKEMINQKRPLDRQTMLHLMNHPSVMELVDHPEFLERARQAIREIR